MCPSLLDAYLTARRFVEAAGYKSEVEWQAKVSLAALDERTFLSEFAWVVLSAGMRESVVRRLYSRFSEAFFNWTSASDIVDHAEACRDTALTFFNHAGKVNAIIEAASYVAAHGVDEIRNGLSVNGPGYLERLAFMGPVTSVHLAKNLGVEIAKPDRHLLRIAHAARYPSVTDLCEDISRATQDSVAVVDIVLWRYATLEHNYLERFSVR